LPQPEGAAAGRLPASLRGGGYDPANGNGTRMLADFQDFFFLFLTSLIRDYSAIPPPTLWLPVYHHYWRAVIFTGVIIRLSIFAGVKITGGLRTRFRSGRHRSFQRQGAKQHPCLQSQLGCGTDLASILFVHCATALDALNRVELDSIGHHLGVLLDKSKVDLGAGLDEDEIVRMIFGLLWRFRCLRHCCLQFLLRQLSIIKVEYEYISKYGKRQDIFRILRKKIG
jgi:hypothetical protein